MSKVIKLAAKRDRAPIQCLGCIHLTPPDTEGGPLAPECDAVPILVGREDVPEQVMDWAEQVELILVGLLHERAEQIRCPLWADRGQK